MEIYKLSIIIPAFNEGRTIHHILNKVKNANLLNNIKKEVIVINDSSTNNTEESVLKYKAENPEINIQYFKHEKNKSKGAALHTGIKKTTGEYLIIQDADLEYDPQEYNLLLKPVINGFADVVYGSRFLGGNAHRILFFGIQSVTNCLRLYPICLRILTSRIWKLVISYLTRLSQFEAKNGYF